ncbi:MAG: DUF2764 family protein [Lentisphaeria bacterium]|nr:DUF2764 family protein [Lentisphaeria bacterium]
MKYYYFISTLPMLDFQRPAFDGGVRAFDEMCGSSLAPEDAEFLLSVTLDNPPAEKIASRVHSQFILWDTNLRNAIANAAMPNGNARKYLQKEEDFFSGIDYIVQNAAAKDDPLERDRMIDQARFEKIEELSALNNFDIEFLAAYRMKLLIIEKYASLSVEQGEKNFDILVQEILEENRKKL